MAIDDRGFILPVKSDVKSDDPHITKILGAMAIAAAHRPHPSTLPIKEQRLRFQKDMTYWNIDGPELPRICEGSFPGPGGALSYRLYDPIGDRKLRPTVLYLHGGGWCLGDLDSEDRMLRELARASGFMIFSLAYRLAPEHKFPAAILDCCAALEFLQTHGESIGVDRAKIALGGLSAGANIALSAALKTRDAKGASVKYIILQQGGYGAGETESLQDIGRGGYGLDRRSIESYYNFYLNHPTEREDPLVSQLNANLRGLPPVYINSAGLDPLRDDSRLLAIKLKDAGVSVQFDEYEQMIHGFTLMSRRVESAHQAVKTLSISLKNYVEYA